MQKLLQRLQKLESAVVADVLYAMGLQQQVLKPNIQALQYDQILVGRVLTAQGNEDRFSQGLANFEIDEQVFDGAIVLIDTQNCDKGAVIGDNMATAMQKAGAKGFVILGGIRDSEVFLERNIPIYFQYKSPINAFSHWSLKSVGETIMVPGIRGDIEVANQDYLIADNDGVVIIPQQHIERVLSDSETHLKCENTIQARVSAGESRRQVSAEMKRLSHVKKL